MSTNRPTSLLLALTLGLCGSRAAAQEEFPDIAPKPGWDTLPAARADANDWPWWRGPNLDNVAPPGQTPPTAWTKDSGILWQTRLPGLGHSTPVVVGPRIYVTSGDHAQGTLWLFCLERDTGKTLWQTVIYQGPVAKLHADNALASATPACDGERLFVPYQSADAVGLAAVSLNGDLLWRKTLAPYKTIQGFSASPAFYKSAVILPTEGANGCRMTALHRATGGVVWRTTLRTVKESYASPLVARVAGRDQLLLIGGESTRGYNPENGALLWECEGPSTYCGATPAFGADRIYATAGWPKRALFAIRADGHGDVTKSHLLWASDAKAGYVPSPVLRDGLLYAVNDQGLLRCYDADDGKVLWEENLRNPVYSSPLVADGKVYVFDRKGNGYIMDARREKSLVTTNALPSGVFATPVILNSRLYLRTLGDLYCIGAR